MSELNDVNQRAKGTAPSAGRFALKLAKRIAEIDRDSLGLPKEMNLRSAMHAGPVYRYKDQIIDKLNYIGSHVNRAARIAQTPRAVAILSVYC